MIYLYSLLTIIIFVFGLKLSQKLKSSILNPFIISLILLVSIMVAAELPYQDYYQGNWLLNKLLGISVVALALPFYEQFANIRQQWKSILLIILFATLFSMLSGVLLALVLGGNQSILASILPKSVTTPIAIAIAGEIGGESAVSAVGVTIAGITGSAFGYAILKACRIHHPQAMGLSIGAVSHALGTGRAMEIDSKIGSYSSIALVLCGVISSLFAPLVFKFTLLFL